MFSKIKYLFFKKKPVVFALVGYRGCGKDYIFKELLNHNGNDKEIDLIINSPADIKSKEDSTAIRSNAIVYDIPYFTTMEAAKAAIEAITAIKKGEGKVKPLQDYY